jgi:DNA-directed RNA polymerase subunit RPC12/RpoP
MATYNCERCGNEFSDKPSRNRRYCSHACANAVIMASRAVERAFFECLACGEIFEALPSQRVGYCSYQCSQWGNAQKRRRTGPEYIVDEQTGCWVWQAGSGRYGALSKGGKKVAAHREMWERMRGPLPNGATVHHRCENKRCVNPSHLQVMRRGTHTRRHRAQLTPEQVRTIRKSKERTSVLARSYGVSEPTISDIRHGRTWKDL